MAPSRKSAVQGEFVGDSQRKIAFAGAALALLMIAVLLAFREPGRRVQPDGHPPVGTTAIRTGQPPVGPPATDTPGSASASSMSRLSSPPAGGTGPREREARRAPAVAPGEAALAERAARAFLVGYLPYSYGRVRADRIRAAAGRLMRELERMPPRVPAAVARGDPRLISVRAEAPVGDHVVDVLAVVGDGHRRYNVVLESRRARGAWLVTAVGS
jgi:hypothetical protein